MCVLRLGDILSTLLQATTALGLKQVSKFVEAETKEMSYRKRIYVSVVFVVCAGVHTFLVCTSVHSFTIFLSSLYPTPSLCGCPQWITPKNVPLLFIIAGTNSPPIIELNSSKQLNHIKRILSTSNSQKRNFLDEYKNCFGEISTILKVQHNNIDQTIIPVTKTRV